jgi:hypothetical protein
MSYLGQQADWRDADFQYRIGQAARKTALDIAAEDAGTAGHAARTAYGHSVLLGGVSEELLARAVVCDDTTTKAATDAALVTRLAAIWNALAGV